MDQTERLRALFDGLADSYDQVGVDFFVPIAEGLVRELAPQAGESVLDLGCGRGAALLAAARAVGPDGVVVGGDLAPAMVAQARDLAAAEGLRTVEVLELDAQEPTLPDGVSPSAGFDVASASLVLFFLPDPAAALRRWRDLVRPGGRIGVSTFGPSSAAWQEIDALFQPYLPAQFRDARTTGTQGPFESDAGVEGLLRDAGFEDVRTATHDQSVRFEDPDHWYRFTMSTGQRGFWMMMPEADRPKVRAAAGRIIAEHAGPDGSTTFHQTARYTIGRRPQAVEAAS